MASLNQIIFTPLMVVFTHFLFFVPSSFDRSHKRTRILQGIQCGNVQALNIVPFKILLEVLIVLYWSYQFLVNSEAPASYSCS